MAPAPSTELTRTERDVLDHYKEGVGARTIAMRVNLETADVQTIINEVAGGDRTRAASLVAAYNRRHPDEVPLPVPAPYSLADTPSSPPSPPPTPAPSSPPAPASGRRGRPAGATTKRPRAAAQAPQDDPVAPTVVPVDLSETVALDVPVTAIADPAPADLEEPAPPAAAPADPLGAPDGAAAAAQVLAEQLPTVGHWAGARAPGLPIEACTHGGDCPVHPNAQSLHNFDADPRAADLDFPALAAAPALVDPLDGPTEDLPAVASFDELMAAVAAVPELAELAGRVTTLVDVLHDRYDRERQSRKVRGEALIIRRELDTRLALLARLANPSAATTTAAAAAA